MPTIRFHIPAILLLCAFPLFGQSVRLSLELDRDIYRNSVQNNLYLQATVHVEGEQNASLPPNDVVFLVDRSGSMEGVKLEQTKIAFREALAQLSSNDTVTVITYGSTVETLIPPIPVDKISSHSAAIENLTSEGGSALHEGIATALDSIRKNHQDTSVPHIILITDGPPNKGPRDAASFASLFSRKAQGPLKFTCLFIAEGTTEQEKQALGTLLPSPPVVVEDSKSLPRATADALMSVHPKAGSDAVLEITFESGIKIKESIGRESEISGRTIRFQLGDLRANQELKAITQATLAAGKSIHWQTRVATATLTYSPSPQNKESPVVIEQEIRTSFSPSASVSFDSIQIHVYQSVCEAEVSDTLMESNQWQQEGQTRKALRELKKLSRDIRSVARGLPDLQVDEPINQLNLAIKQIEDARDASIERTARDKTLYPSATSPNDE